MDKTLPAPACKRCKWVPIPVRGALMLDSEGLCFYCRNNIPHPVLDKREIIR